MPGQDALSNPASAKAKVSLKTDDGRQLDVALWAEHLAASREGRRVAKRPGTWDPVLLPMTAETTATGTPQK